MELRDLSAAPVPPVAAAILQQLLPSAQILELLPVALYVCDAHGRVLAFNRRAVELWGREPRLGDDAERFCGSHRVFLDGREIAREQTPMARVLATGEPIHGKEAEVQRPDGSRIWAIVHIDPIKDEDGNVLGAINCFHETTAVHRADEARREQEQRLAATYEHATIGISEVDAEGRLLRVNEAACAITGRSRAELLERTIFHRAYPEECELDRSKYRQLMAGEIDRYSLQKRVVRKDDRVIWIAMSCAAVRDAAGAFRYAVRVFQDITEAKRAVEALSESEQRLAATYNHAGLAISEVDQDGRLLRVNEAATAITGYSRDELLEMRIFDITHPDDREADRAQFARQTDSSGSYSAEKRLIRKDGSEIWVSVTSSTVHDPDGRFRYGVRVIQDVTQRKQAEGRQQVLLDELNHRVKNTLATVQALASQTARRARTTKAFRERLEGRLIALSEAHNLLSRGNWERADLRELAAAALAPFTHEFANNITVAGTPIFVPPRTALALAMIFHELATNAAKYGALSQPTGRLRVSWEIAGNGHGQLLRLAWEESGGPMVAPPTRRGFGTTLIERGVGSDLGGSASLRFEPTGVCCEIEAPI